MTRAFYLDHPEVLALEATILDARPGAVLLDRSPIFPGGGGQLPDRGILSWSGVSLPVTRIIADPLGVWHEFESDAEPHGQVLVTVDAAFRHLMCELHTLAHVLNALVFREFGGALLTGASFSADSTFRVDFDLPSADMERLRLLDDPLNEVIRRDLVVRTGYMPYEAAQAMPGLFRSKSVAPPPAEDGQVRIVEIVDLDRQACGGTHLISTGLARPARIVKIDNKGRQNRRIKVAVGRDART